MKSTKKIVLTSILGALGGAIGFAESLIPAPLPGGRLGLANIITLTALNVLGFKYAICVSILKSLIALLLFGSVVSLPYSLAGGIFSVISMALALKYIKGISAVGAGVIGAFANNLAQTAVGALIMSNKYILSYIWVLGFVSVVTGFFTGLASKYMTRYINLK